MTIPSFDAVRRNLENDAKTLDSLGHATLEGRQRIQNQSSVTQAVKQNLPYFYSYNKTFEIDPGKGSYVPFNLAGYNQQVLDGMAATIDQIQKDVESALKIALDPKRVVDARQAEELESLVRLLDTKLVYLFGQENTVKFNLLSVFGENFKDAASYQKKTEQLLKLNEQFKQLEARVKSNLTLLEGATKTHASFEQSMINPNRFYEGSAAASTPIPSHSLLARPSEVEEPLVSASTPIPTKFVHNKESDDAPVPATAKTTDTYIPQPPEEQQVDDLPPPPPPPPFGGPPPPPAMPKAAQTQPKKTDEELRAEHSAKETNRLQGLLEKRSNPDNWTTRRRPPPDALNVLEIRREQLEGLIAKTPEANRQFLWQALAEITAEIDGPIVPLSASAADKILIQRKLNELTTDELKLLYGYAYSQLSDDEIARSEMLKRAESGFTPSVREDVEKLLNNPTASVNAFQANKDKWLAFLNKQKLSLIFAEEIRAKLGERNRNPNTEPKYEPKEYRAKKEIVEEVPQEDLSKVLFSKIREGASLKKVAPQAAKTVEKTELQKRSEALEAKRKQRPAGAEQPLAQSSAAAPSFTSNLRKVAANPKLEAQLVEGYKMQFYQLQFDRLQRLDAQNREAFLFLKDKFAPLTPEEEALIDVQALERERESLRPRYDELLRLEKDFKLAQKAKEANFDPRKSVFASRFIEQCNKLEVDGKKLIDVFVKKQQEDRNKR